MAMGMPEINIVFKSAAAADAEKSKAGRLAMILLDAAQLSSRSFTVRDMADVPSSLSAVNRAYIEQALLGGRAKPVRILVYVLAATAEDLEDALDYFATQNFDYMVGPVDCSAAQATEIKTWIRARRDTYHEIYKAVLPNCAADDEAIVNFTAAGIKVGATTYDAAGYCSRVAGILAGTPLQNSATYAILDEVTDCTRLTPEEMDTAVNAGKLILYSNGRKVRLGRAVNSLNTTTSDKGAAFKKVKIVSVVDTITSHLRELIEDNYIGKYPNSYDNKMVLKTAITDYLDEMARQEIVHSYTMDLDVQAIKAYLEDHGTDTSEMTEAEIRHAPTGTYVGFAGTATIYDDIEDVDVTIAFTV